MTHDTSLDLDGHHFSLSPNDKYETAGVTVQGKRYKVLTDSTISSWAEDNFALLARHHPTESPEELCTRLKATWSELKKLDTADEWLSTAPLDDIEKKLRNLPPAAMSERISLAHALERYNPLAFALFFPLLEIADPAEIAHHKEVVASLAEPLKEYHLDVQEGIVDERLPSICDQEILVEGVVFSDGLGDFFNLKAVVTALQEKYPGQKVRLLVAIAKEHYEKNKAIFTCPPSVSFELEFAQTTDIKPSPRRCLLPQTQERVATAAYVVQLTPPLLITTPLPIKADMILEEPGHKGLGLKEGDYGLFIPDVSKVKSDVKELKDSWLREKLAPALERGDIVSKIYLTNPSILTMGGLDDINYTPHFACMKRMGSFSPKDKNLAIICSDIPPEEYLRKLQSEFDEIICETKGEEPRIFTLTDKMPKRTLTLLHPLRLPHEDMLTVQSLINCPLVACTGDQSFAEVIAFNNCLPIYQVREHKEGLWNQYREKALAILKGTHPYVQHLYRHSTLTPENLPACLEGAKRFHDWIKTEKNASLALPEAIAKSIHARLAAAKDT